MPAEGALETCTLPQTIEDAITVTKEMGYCYLWVDALCIDQTQNANPQQRAEKEQQLCMMDMIYSSATLTLIAMAGADSNVGLLGVAPRTPHPAAHRDRCRPHPVHRPARPHGRTSRLRLGHPRLDAAGGDPLPSPPLLHPLTARIPVQPQPHPRVARHGHPPRVDEPAAGNSRHARPRGVSGMSRPDSPFSPDETNPQANHPHHPASRIPPSLRCLLAHHVRLHLPRHDQRERLPQRLTRRPQRVGTHAAPAGLVRVGPPAQGAPGVSGVDASAWGRGFAEAAAGVSVVVVDGLGGGGEY